MSRRHCRPALCRRARLAEWTIGACQALPFTDLVGTRAKAAVTAFEAHLTGQTRLAVRATTVHVGLRSVHNAIVALGGGTHVVRTHAARAGRGIIAVGAIGAELTVRPPTVDPCLFTIQHPVFAGRLQAELR